jgi:hypothetical protein
MPVAGQYCSSKGSMAQGIWPKVCGDRVITVGRMCKHRKLNLMIGCLSKLEVKTKIDLRHDA